MRPEESSHTPVFTLLKDYNPEKHFAPFSRLNLTLHIPDTFFFFLYLYHQFMLIFFAFDNDDMESSKRRVTFLSLIFLLKCMSKSIVIKTNRLWFNEGMV